MIRNKAKYSLFENVRLNLTFENKIKRSSTINSTNIAIISPFVADKYMYINAEKKLNTLKEKLSICFERKN